MKKILVKFETLYIKIQTTQSNTHITNDVSTFVQQKISKKEKRKRKQNSPLKEVQVL